MASECCRGEVKYRLEYDRTFYSINSLIQASAVMGDFLLGELKHSGDYCDLYCWLSSCSELAEYGGVVCWFGFFVCCFFCYMYIFVTESGCSMKLKFCTYSGGVFGLDLIVRVFSSSVHMKQQSTLNEWCLNWGELWRVSFLMRMRHCCK